MFEIAKKIILDNVYPKDTKAKGNEKSVSKNDAFSHYIEAAKKIQTRLKAINSSDDRTTFLINDGLVEQL